MKPRRRRTLSELNQSRVGLVTIVLAALLLVGGIRLNTILDLFGQQHYTAQFADAGALRSGAAVRIDGVQVGKVESIGLAGQHVLVKFAAAGVHLGDESSAAIKSENALGRKFLALSPAGTGDIRDIPLARTDAGISVTQTLGGLTQNSSEIDVKQLADSFNSLSSVLQSTPDEFKGALTGVSRLSETISSRDAELRQLLARANSISDVLAQRNKTLLTIFNSGSEIFAELAQRQQDIVALLKEVRAAAQQVAGLVDDNQAGYARDLEALSTLSRTLNKYRGNIGYVLQEFAPYARSLGEAVGSGPFYQAYIANLTYPEALATGTVSSVVQDTLSQLGIGAKK